MGGFWVDKHKEIHSGRTALCSDTLVSTCATWYKPKLIMTASCRFWGFEPYISATDQFAHRPINSKPGTFLFFYPALEESPHSLHHRGLEHLAFMVESRAAVHAVHAKVQVLGSEVVHPPRLFPQYRPQYYATFWLDPEGFMLEAVCLTEEEST